jgi:hypothetical protein
MSDMRKTIFPFIAALSLSFNMMAQQVTLSSDQIKALTPDWTGERTPDGRPKVPDKLLDRVKNIRIEEAWGVLRNKGFQNQYEGEWMIMWPDSAMVGRVVTAQYLPLRPKIPASFQCQELNWISI